MIADCCTAFSQIRKRKKEKLLQENWGFRQWNLKGWKRKLAKAFQPQDDNAIPFDKNTLTSMISEPYVPVGRKKVGPGKNSLYVNT